MAWPNPMVPTARIHPAMTSRYDDAAVPWHNAAVANGHPGHTLARNDLTAAAISSAAVALPAGGNTGAGEDANCCICAETSAPAAGSCTAA